MKDKYLIFLQKALANVATEYHSEYALHFADANVEALNLEQLRQYKQSIERNFAYELYHQFRLLMESKENKDLFSELRLNGEITKIGFNDQVLRRRVIIPDLVLHYGQLNINPIYQRIFIEIKTDEEPDLAADISKLVFAVQPPLNFQYSVMLCINSTLHYLKHAISNDVLVSTLDQSILKKIYLFTPNHTCTFNKIVKRNV